jgi:prepilin-type N-terminal cleavage/methylation domain-containing protein
MVSKRRAGYTLVELMLVVTIVGIISATGAGIMLQAIRYFRFQKARIEIQRDARTALDLINRSLREGQASTVVVDQATNQPPYSRIAFTTVTGRSLTFYQNNQDLMMIQGTATTKICGNLKYLGFTYPQSQNSGIVSVSLTLEEATYETRTKALQLSVQTVRIMN